GGRRGARPPPHPAKPPQPGAAVAEDALPQADGQALPEETEGEAASAGVRAALAGGKRLLPAQAAARLGPWCQVGRLARARVLPARAHPQHHAPRSYRIEGFNRATIRASPVASALGGKPRGADAAPPAAGSPPGRVVAPPPRLQLGQGPGLLWVQVLAPPPDPLQTPPHA